MTITAAAVLAFVVLSVAGRRTGLLPGFEVPAQADVVHMMSHIFAHPEWASLDRFFH